MSCPLFRDHPTEFANASELIKHGVPIFLAEPADTFPKGGSGDTGYLFPPRWQDTRPDQEVLAAWQPGMALCAVMGHSVDGLDIDTNKGGVVSGDLRPISYGRQRTPSGGTHDFISPLGLRSRDGLLPGVDYKGGAGDLGRGFLFLAPTRKLSKVTGEVKEYVWELELELDLLVLVGGDDSGRELAKLIQTSRNGNGDGRPTYEGPGYEHLSEQHQEQSDRYVEDTLFEWRVRMADAAGWEEGRTDYAGRGWEALTRDCAWTVAKLAVCPWTGLLEDNAEQTFNTLLPRDIAIDTKCRGKWHEGILEKAAATVSDQPPWWSELFFEQTPVLAHIRQAAMSGSCVPDGILAVLLARILAEVPPRVMLPPLTSDGQGGSPASLNLGVAMVAKSGGGKSATIDSTRGLLGFHGLDQVHLEEGAGSGEGMIDVFLTEELVPDPKKDGEMKATGRLVLKEDPRAIFNIDEVATLAAAGRDRAGSTLTATMRTALTGGPLKTANARAGGRSRKVEGKTYRIVILAGVQPDLAGVLLSPEEEAVGTPQRFLWTKLTDKDINFAKPRPPSPGPLDWEPPGSWPDMVKYPDHVRESLLDQYERQVLEQTDSAEGHAMLTRLKVAFALAVLHREVEITDQWWSLAGVMVEKSRQVQAECKKILGEVAQVQEIKRATRSAKAAMKAEDAVSGDRLDDCAQALIARLRRNPGTEFSWSQVKPAGRMRVGLETTEIIEHARKTPGVQIIEREAQGRTAYALKWEE